MSLARALLAAALLALLPTTAEACPACAGRNDGGAGRIAALAAMMVLPFALTALVLPVLRRRPDADS